MTELNVGEGDLSFRRHDRPWREPWLDGIDYFQLIDPAAIQGAFEQKEIDWIAPPQKAVVDELLSRYDGETWNEKVFTPNPIASSINAAGPPFSDLRIPQAISQAMDRRGLIQQLFQGNGVISASTPPGWAPYALPEAELITFPGYLPDRDADIADAKAMWEAAGGPDLGEFVFDIPDIFEGTYAGVSSLLTTHMHSVFGNEFRAELVPYATITSKLVSGQYGNGNNSMWWGWTNPPSDPDASVGLVSFRHSTGTQGKQFGVVVPGLDALLDELALEFDVDRRIEMSHDVSRLILPYVDGGLPHLMEGISDIIGWNYLHIGEVTLHVTAQNIAPDYWLDPSDSTFAGRPS
jgi:ABC-type transport system substrate-binding protein